MKNSNVSIIILSYNTKDITLTSAKYALIAGSHSEKVLKNKVEVIVVDNDSHDGTIEAIKKKYPQVLLSAQKKNLGVATGYNIGMKMSKAPYILILNSDLYLDETAIVDSIKYMQANEKCDALMCRLTNGNGEMSNTGGHLPNPLNTISWLVGLENIPYVKNILPRIYDFDQRSYATERTVEWVPSCFFFMRRKVFDITHGLDENIFLYMEDLEWCKRIADKNLSIWFTPSFHSVHLGGMSAEKKLPSLYIMQRQIEGIKYYQKKHYPHTAFLVTAFLYLGYSMRSLFYFIMGDFSRSVTYLKVLSTPISTA